MLCFLVAKLLFLAYGLLFVASGLLVLAYRIMLFGPWAVFFGYGSWLVLITLISLHQNRPGGMRVAIEYGQPLRAQPC